MTTGPDPWEEVAIVTRHPLGRSKLLRRPNLPYLLAIVAASAVLIPFLLFAEPFATGENAIAASTAATNTTTAITVAGGISTTIASTTGAAATTSPFARGGPARTPPTRHE